VGPHSREESEVNVWVLDSLIPRGLPWASVFHPFRVRQLSFSLCLHNRELSCWKGLKEKYAPLENTGKEITFDSCITPSGLLERMVGRFIPV